ncbi:MAG: 2-C-methyl-D-erythritol 4-phosphate cytidylyltransferase [Candidatus Erwinia impunctatus]|nr:2-C-methyl-D-erythritol 4-phosphate cytidylyltransferase [Culicoides impunctatus]
MAAKNNPLVTAIVPAAGIGSRMGNTIPKQYLQIAGKTVIEHAVDRLRSHPAITRIIIALSAEDHYFSRLPLADDPAITLVTGGNTRADSVMAGLQIVAAAPWVLVHDAARPCLHHDDLTALLRLTGCSEVGGILAAPVRDTIKRAEADQSVIAHTVPREALWHALTPQLFPGALLFQCLQRALNNGVTVTDEASALEYCGYRPQLVSGRNDNIKITCPEDLALAAFYLTQLLK